MNQLIARPRSRWVVPPAISILPAKRGRSFRVFTLPYKSLGLLSLGSFVLLTFVSMVLIVYGRSVPAIPDEGILPGLRRCAGTPCFHELIPGQTSWADALAAFGGSAIFTGDSTYSQLTLLPSTQGDKLAGILLNGPFDPPLTIGALMTVYDAPPCVEIYPNSGALILHFDSLHVLARAASGHFTPFTRILSIVLGNPIDESQQDSRRCDPTSSGKDSRAASGNRWHGFAIRESYLNGLRWLAGQPVN